MKRTNCASPPTIPTHTYTDTYTEIGRKIVDRATRLRLAELADAFEFEDCVNECLSSLGRDLTLESAITALDDIPEHLRQHSAIDDLKELVQSALIIEIDKLATVYNMKGRNYPEAERELLSKAGAVLAELLGPVEDFIYGFEPLDSGGDRLKFYHQFSLNDEIAELPVTVMRVLLASDALQVKSENETYTFLIAWLLQAEDIKEDDMFPTFKKMIDLLRFEHFSPDFVMNVVNYCPFVVAEDDDGKVMGEIMWKAFSRRHANAALLRKAGLSSNVKDRGTGQEATWTLGSSIPDWLLHSLPPGKRYTETLGLVNGYPVQFIIAHRLDGQLGIYFNVLYPHCGMYLDDRERRGVGMRATFQVNDFAAESMEHFFLEGESYTSPACFGHRAWEEVVDTGNKALYFPDGGFLTVKVTYTLLTE